VDGEERPGDGAESRGRDSGSRSNVAYIKPMTEQPSGTATLRVALVGPSRQALDGLARILPPGAIVVGSAEGGTLREAQARSELAASEPEIGVVEGTGPDDLIDLLVLLHRELHGTWFLAVGESQDPQLIIRAVRAGAREYLPRPVTAEATRAAVDRFLLENPRRDRHEGKVYAVTAAKGGSGATSVAINLAAATARLPKTRVALVDLTYPLGDVAAYLNLESKYTLSDALRAASRLDPVLLRTFMSQKSDTFVLAGQAKIERLPQAAAGGVSRLVGVLAESFSHSVLDLSGGAGEDFLQAATEKADAILVVLTAEIPAIWRTLRLVRYLDEVGHGDKIKVLLNRSQKRSEISPREIEKTLERPIHWEIPNNYRATLESINAGLPVVEVNNSGLARSFGELAQDLTGIRAVRKKTGLRGWFS
jgi:pilus assembly protein CpaE